MGYRAQKKYSQSNTDILEAVEYLAEITKGIEHDTELIRHKLNQMDGNINLVMDTQIEIGKSLYTIINKHDRLENMIYGIGNVLTASVLVILVATFGAMIILA